MCYVVSFTFKLLSLHCEIHLNDDMLLIYYDDITHKNSTEKTYSIACIDQARKLEVKS